MIFCCLIKIPSRFANDCTWFEIFTLKQNTRPEFHKTRSGNLGLIILQKVYVIFTFILHSANGRQNHFHLVRYIKQFYVVFLSSNVVETVHG